VADEPREKGLGLGLDPLDAPDDHVVVVLEGIARLVDVLAGVVVGARRLALGPVKLKPVAGHARECTAALRCGLEPAQAGAEGPLN
jgi:hypothetical protein